MVRSCLAPDAGDRPELTEVCSLLRDMLTSAGQTEVLDQITRIQRQPLIPPTITFPGPDTSSEERSVSPLLATPMAHFSVIDPGVSRFALIAACVVLVVVGLAAGLAIHSLFESKPTVIVARTPPSEPIAATAAMKSPAPKVEAPPPPAPPVESAPIVELDSRPTGASVFDVESGRLLGKTPMELVLSNGAPKSVRLQRAGLITKTVVLDAGIKQHTVKLSKSKRTRALDEKATLPW